MKLSHEWAMLLALLQLDEEPASRISELLDSGLDWQALQKLAVEQDLVPLVYHRLRPYAASVIPGMARLEELYAWNGKRNLFLVQTLLRVLDILERAGIQAVTLKGPVLALQAYGDLSLRHYVDLDILIRQQDVERACQTLHQVGWRSPILNRPGTLSWLLRSEKDISLQRDQDLLDLHWNVAERGMVRSIPVERWWQDLQSLDLLHHNLLVLSPENSVLFLSLHGLKNGWLPLKLMVDLAKFLHAHPGLDWDLIDRRAQRWGLQRGLATGLILAEYYCGITLPLPVRERYFSIRGANNLAREVSRAADRPDPNLTELSGAWYYLRSRERLRDRLDYIVDQAFIPKQDDWRSSKLPTPIYPLFFLIRPGRLLYKFAFKPLVSGKRT